MFDNEEFEDLFRGINDNNDNNGAGYSYSQMGKSARKVMVSIVEGLDYEGRIEMVRHLSDQIKNYPEGLEAMGYHQLFTTCAVLSAVRYKENSGDSSLIEAFINEGLNGDE